jgi:hypothetical protein
VGQTEVVAGGRLTDWISLGVLASWVPADEPLAELFSQVARPVADMVTAGAFLGRWRLMSIDGLEWDVPDTPANAAFFGFTGTGKDEAPGAFPKARMVTVNECASHAAVLAAIGPAASKGSGEQSLARRDVQRLPARGQQGRPQANERGSPLLVHLPAQRH